MNVLVVFVQLLITNCLINTVKSQTCLTNPPGVSHNPSNEGDVAWTEIEDGVYHTSIVFDVTYYPKEETGWPCEIRVRSHNYSHPSPTLYMHPGNQYQMTFYNLLGAESEEINIHHNEPHDPNTTNVHTHGAHISPEAPGDSVSIVAYPGSNITYYWELPCNHFSGASFWHPHYHGSTALHVAYGASGAMIVEQDEDWKYEYYEGQPEWLYSMKSLVMVLHYWDYEFRDARFNTDENYTLDYVTWFDINDTECYVETENAGGPQGPPGGPPDGPPGRNRIRRRNSRRRRTLERRKNELEIQLQENINNDERRDLMESKNSRTMIKKKLFEINRKLSEYDGSFNSYTRREHDRRLMQEDDGEDLADGTWYTINGEYEPTVCLTAGEWLKMRILYVNGEEEMNVYLTSDIISNFTMEELNVTDFCQMYLVAKDGVLIHIDAPRKINSMFFSPANRADVLINCVAMASEDREYWGTDLGSYELQFEDGDGRLISTISVIGYDTEREFNLTSYIPNRSDYTPDLRDVPRKDLTVWKDNSTTYDISISRNAVNNIGFVSIDNYSEFLYVNKTAEWNVSHDGRLVHPIHIHVIPFQVINSDIVRADVDSNWHKDGDYYDTFWFEGVIRFLPSTFGGTLVYHCHILHHEDLGAMDVSYINNGCDAQWNPLNNKSICIRPSCPSYYDYINTTRFNNGTWTTTTPNTSKQEREDDDDNNNNNKKSLLGTLIITIFVIMSGVIVLILFVCLCLLYQNKQLKKNFETDVEKDLNNAVQSPLSTQV